MKKILALLLALTLVFSFAACGNTETPTEPSEPAGSQVENQTEDQNTVQEDPVELIVFAAASMTETLT